MAKLFDPDSTLNPPNPKVAIYPFGAFNDSILLAKFVGNTRFSPRLKYIEHTVELPWDEKMNFHSTFHMRGTDETFMVETAVCPM